MKALLRGPLPAMALFVMLLECALRAAPGLVPLGVLEQYEPSLRARIAGSLRLPLREDTRLVPRGDGGPPDVMWVHRPGAEVTWNLEEPGVEKTVRMDGRGFCNPPGSTDQAHPGPVDIVAVGDSFTFCSAVPAGATWVARVAAMLGVEADDLGMPGRGPFEYVEMLRRFGLERRPRVVVLAIYEGNDLRDAVAFHRGAVERDATASCRPHDLPCRVAAGWQELPLVRRSYALGFAPALLRRLLLLNRKREIDFRYSVTLPDGSTLALNSRNGDRDEVETARALEAGTVSTAVFDPALAALRELAAEHSFVPVLLYLPAAYTAYDAMASFDDASIHATMRAYSLGLRRYFETASAREGLLFLDATEELAAAAAKGGTHEPPYFPLNVHLTKAGHAVVAGLLARFLSERVALETTKPGANPGLREDTIGAGPRGRDRRLAVTDGTAGPSSGTGR